MLETCNIKLINFCTKYQPKDERKLRETVILSGIPMVGRLVIEMTCVFLRGCEEGLRKTMWSAKLSLSVEAMKIVLAHRPVGSLHTQAYTHLTGVSHIPS